MKESTILQDLIRYNTAEDAENKLAVEEIEEVLKRHGFVTKTIEDNYTKKRCLVATINNPTLGFLMHLDTCTVGGKWSVNPNELTEMGDKLIGLGICDMKGGIGAVLNAVLDSNFHVLKNGVALYFTFDEQVGFDGVNLLQSRGIEFTRRLISPHATSLRPVVSCKGTIECNMLFKGVEVHSAHINKGDNAIDKMMECVAELKAFANKLAENKDNAYEIPYTTLNISKVSGGSAINKVAGDASVFFDFRTIRAEHHDMILDKVKELSIKYNAFHTIINNIKPMQCQDSEFIDTIEKLTGKTRSTTAIVSEGAFVPNSDVILLGPGPNTSNEADEYISSFSYNNAIKLYKDLISIYCK